MTKKGLAVAAAYGEKLPEFGSLRDAKKALFAQRDDALDHLREVTAKAGLAIDQEDPQSLLPLEKWYFEMVATRGFRRLNTTKTRIEEAFGFFVASLLVKKGATWIVERFAFGGSGYEIGISLHSLFSISGVDGLFADLDGTQPNKTQRLMLREYTNYASSVKKTSSAKKKAAPKKTTAKRSSAASETTRSTKTGPSRTGKTATKKLSLKRG